MVSLALRRRWALRAERRSLRRVAAAMDAESIAALAMCGMVGEAAVPSVKTSIGDIRVNEEVDVRYNSDGGFYRAKVSAIDEDTIKVTYPEDQVGTTPSAVSLQPSRRQRSAALPAASAVQLRAPSKHSYSFAVTLTVTPIAGCTQTWHESTETIPIADVTSKRMRLPQAQASSVAAAAAAASATRPRLGRKGSPELWQAGSPVEEDAPDSPRATEVPAETVSLPQHRSGAAATGGRARRPVKRAGATTASESDYQPKVKRSRLKSVDVITTADTPFPGWTMERRKTWREK